MEAESKAVDIQLKVTELVTTPLSSRAMKVDPLNNEFKPENTIFVRCTDGNYALCITYNGCIQVALFNCKDFRWFGKIYSIDDLSTNHMTGYYLGSNKFVVISDNGMKFVMLVSVNEDITIALDLLEVDYMQRSLLTYIGYRRVVRMLYKASDNEAAQIDIFLNEDGSDFKTIVSNGMITMPDFTTMVASYQLEMNYILFLTDNGLFLFDSEVGRFSEVVSNKSDVFKINREYKYGYIFPDPEKLDTVIIFASFLKSPGRTSYLVGNPMKLTLSNTHYLLISWINSITWPSSFFSPDKNTVIAFKTDSILEVLSLGYPPSPLPPIVKSSPDKKLLVTFEIPKYEYWYLIHSMYLKIMTGNGRYTSREINFVNGCTLSLVMPESRRYHATLEAHGKFGILSSSLVEFQSYDTFEPTDIKVRYDGDNVLITWKSTSPSDGILIEGAQSKVAEFEKLMFFKNPTVNGVVAKIPEEIRYFRVSSIRDGRGYPSAIAKIKAEAIRTVFNKEQKIKLERIFKINPTPKIRQRDEIARELNIPLKSVTYWFQNRRSLENGSRKGLKYDVEEEESEDVFDSDLKDGDL
ncbi:Homeobox domain containing protein [Trichomonas vaginalis G3]|uniref:Homeobox domain containing protein n=1 Tax=Trichomonas vaginalis (strain ATCC PRA-98 / G3) TaxID=412133 RepID=A2EE36_TRIV3|nr:homeodomain-containing family [Trichomonas vaginalis G3]EAY09033.1 Homeobox domain containing protein [Trichomonas vaginalis G3]KAI5503453.1 homeodomain-containing family [Trichomonas vaginalis G3]|eukprot:XP_001321256.1 Homeobox domain containing protein [Trichomonas vaginalis G3]